MQNRILEPTALPISGGTIDLTGTGPILARQQLAGRMFGTVWNQTDPLFQSRPEPLAGYPNPLLTLLRTYSYVER